MVVDSLLFSAVKIVPAKASTVPDGKFMNVQEGSVSWRAATCVATTTNFVWDCFVLEWKKQHRNGVFFAISQHHT